MKPTDIKDRGFAIFAACAVAGLIILAVVLLLQARDAGPVAKPISYTQFLAQVEGGQMRKVALIGPKIVGRLADNSYVKTFAPEDPQLIPDLRRKGVTITVEKPPAQASGATMVTVIVPVLGFIALIVLGFLFMRPQGGMDRRGTGLGKSRARLRAEDHGRVTFADVAGVDEARSSLQEIVDFLRNPDKFKRLGGRIPRGVLLVGPPGSGKTLLARAIAGEANVPFFTISGSDFVEMFVGVGASRVRDMFDQAKKSAPCIIFMDEIDAVGRKRGAGVGGGNDEREQTLNQLLVEMDGFDANESVILIAATNRPDVLDPALLRPGRFDREIVVAHPDVLGREQILEVHTRKAPLESDVDVKILARRTPGFSGADLMNLVNEAALLAARRAKDAIGMAEFEEARDTVTMGAERRTHVMTEDERRLSAYREGGRAVVALHVPSADPVHKATIIPRGRSGGQVKQLPEEDQQFQTLEQLTSGLAILMAGRAAEELVFGRDKITSGAAKDIEQATKLARNMVAHWGLSEALGPVTYGEDQEEVFLGHSVARQNNVSEETAQAITVEVRALIEAALATSRRILTQYRTQLETLAQTLITHETLTGEEITALLALADKNGEGGRLMNGQGIVVGAAALAALAVLSLSPLAYDRLHATERAAEATKVLNAANDKMMDDMMGDKLVFGGDPDLDFVNMMIPHHVGAIDMAIAEEDLGRDKSVKDLATRIEKAQQPQIDQMQKWRVGRRPVPTADGPAVKDALNAANDKMMTDMTLDEAARKMSPDAQFLIMMIPHHQGAVDMGKAELQYGQNPEIKALAQAIITAQEKEIAEMKAWLKAHGG